MVKRGDKITVHTWDGRQVDGVLVQAVTNYSEGQMLWVKIDLEERIVLSKDLITTSGGNND